MIALLLIAALSIARAEPPDAEETAKIEAMYADYRREFPEVRGITAAELKGHLAEFVLVDVREPREQAVSTLPGAITREQLEADPAAYRDKPLVTYCTIGARSGEYAEQLGARGFDVRNLEGSLLSWTHVGGPLVDADGPTNRVHVYGPTWNLVADDYEAVWQP